MGIDFFAAFNTINRAKHIVLLEAAPCTPAQVCLITYLLQDTTLSIKYQYHVGKAFSASRGTSQGDGRSPTLFTIYLGAVTVELERSLWFHADFFQRKCGYL